MRELIHSQIRAFDYGSARVAYQARCELLATLWAQAKVRYAEKLTREKAA